MKPAISTLEVLPSGRVLDLGCGGGLQIRSLKKELPWLEYYGIDKSKDAISEAKKQEGEIIYKVARAEQIPFLKDFFSAVVSFEVLEHVTDPPKVFSEVNRVLKKGGFFYFTTPLEGDTYNLYGFLNQFGFDPHRKFYGHIQKYSFERLTKMLRIAGFKIKKVSFCAHFINQLWTIFLDINMKIFGKKVNVIYLPLTYPINLVAGVESVLFKNFRWGLDIQITATKK